MQAQVPCMRSSAIAPYMSHTALFSLYRLSIRVHSSYSSGSSHHLMGILRKPFSLWVSGYKLNISEALSYSHSLLIGGK